MARSPLTLALALLGIAACSTVIGIEDLEPGPNPERASGGSESALDGGDGSLGGSSGKTQVPASGGTVNSLGGRGATGGATGTGGSAASGAAPGGGASSSNGGTSTEAGASPTAAAGEESGGAGGSVSESGTVSGTVIDFWKHPLANVPVGIGSVTAITDRDGKFSIPDVTPPYDIWLRIETPSPGYAWVYLGLTHLTPTLQVEDGTATARSASLTLYADGAEFDPEDTVSYTVGTPDGSYSNTIGSTGSNPYPSWEGPAMTNATVHALWWARQPEATAPGPESYLAYTTQAALLADSGDFEYRLDLSPRTVPTRVVQGTVRRSIDEYPSNFLFLRFASNGVMELSQDSASTENFAYTVPEIADAEVVVAASHGNSNGPYGVAYAVASGPNVSLEPPNPPNVISPAASVDNVGPNTVFEWTDVSGIRVLHIEDVDYYRGLYVVTTENRVTFPFVGGDFALRASGVHTWTVEVHGTAQTMDEATGSEGFLDSFSYATEQPRGPRRGDGSYAYSQIRSFTTPP
jgi:hypothetical protein